ncbi:stage V sporulation protein M [Paludifilum halophilum]|uniref:Stage V sporulation protein M n=1 Tax=Paludifilum halophilum TaxID=1642702 RepID=A0A235B280_9BACL|nr:stage V sporulation protein M [Paludifilum halophilum]
MGEGGVGVKFYTIKLPKFLGGMVKVLLGVFNKQK